MISAILRHLPPFKGKQRLGRLLLTRAIQAQGDIVVNGKYGCQYTMPNLKENIGFEILINGIYEEETVDFLIHHMKPNTMLLDIGANIGAITIPVSKRRTDISTICMEAAPWVFTYLQKNIVDNNLKHVTLINKAISDSAGQSVSFYSPLEKYGKGSLAPIFTTDSVAVETITFKELIKSFTTPIGFIKIDVEGFESLAFQGGEELLKKENAPDILFEFVDWAESQANGCYAGKAQSILMEYGYSLYYFDQGKAGLKLDKPITTGSYMFLATKQSY